MWVPIRRLASSVLMCCEYRSAALPVPIRGLASTVSPGGRFQFVALNRSTRGLTNRVHAREVAPAVMRSAADDPKHASVLQSMVAVVHAIDGQTRPCGNVVAHHLGRESAVLCSLLCAELKQHHDQAEVAQQVPAQPRPCEPISHRDGERDPRVVVNQQVQQADDGTGGKVVLALVPDYLGSLERTEEQLDAAFAHLAPGGEFVIADSYDAVLAGVPLLVGELAEKRVEAHRAEPPGSAGVIADRLDGVDADLEERQLASVANRDRRIGRETLGLRSATHDTISSKGRSPRSPAITTHRSSAVQITSPRTGGCPANVPNRSQTGASSA